jgi:peptide/nickel transport system permease protein
MVRFLLTRLIGGTLTLLFAIVLLSISVRLVPGDPARAVLGPRATAALIQRARDEMYLDRPVLEQVVRFVAGAVRGDLGTDFLSRRPVTGYLAAALPHTIALAVSGLGLAVLIGVPLGVVSAQRAGGVVDRGIGLVSIALMTTPTYVTALALLLIFAVGLRVLPATGAGEPGDVRDSLAHMVLPALTLAAVWVGYIARLTRAAMLDALASNAVRAKRAFGIPRARVLFAHALRNAASPIVAVLGIGFGGALGGAVLIEAIFARPGLGKLLVDAVVTRNYPVLRGGVLLTAALYLAANLAAEIAQRWLDPRLREWRA